MKIRVKGWLWTGLIVALFFIGQARAGAVPLQVAGQVAASAASSSGFVTTASATSWSGAAFNSAFTTQVAGKAVTVPATWRLASNAGQLAVNALRINPLGLAASVAASWLIGYGIQYASNQWMAQAQPNTPNSSVIDWSSTGWWSLNATTGCTQSKTCDAQTAAQQALDMAFGAGKVTLYSLGFVGTDTRVGYVSGRRISDGQIFTKTTNILRANPYVAPVPGQVPATDSDWAKVDPATIPDTVLNNLAKDGVSLAVKPTVNTAPQTVPLSDPYVDPVTGKRYQDVAYVTPSADGKTADVQIVKQEIDANGKPVTDPTTGQPKPPEQTDNFNDVPFADIPKLYTQKYPNGIGGVWNDSKPDISNTQFYNGIRSMFPTFGGGQCPVWRMSFNFGGAGNFGAGDLTVPCWIFQALGLVILATAAFTSRKILF